MNAQTRFSPHTVTLILAVLLSLSTPLATGAVLSVTNYGTDSSVCGSSAQPCRSINQAIENASAGDSIWVGAGHYGNIHGDPGYAAPGDEHPQQLQTIFDRFPNCMVCITKPVHIYSYNGAAVTVIDSGPAPTFAATVAIVADGAVFGGADHGFTITGGNGIGVLVDLESWGASVTGVTVAGNVDVGDKTGFMVFGPIFNPNFSCPPGPICMPYRGKILLSGNQAIGNGNWGFFVEPITAAVQLINPAMGQPLQFLIQNNVTVGAGTGFRVEPGVGGFCDDCDFNHGAGDVSIVRNVAADGNVGFSLVRSGSVSQNIATHNSQYGFLMLEGGPFSWNSAIGNSGPGVIAAVEAPYRPGEQPPALFTSFAHNNFFGNDRNRPQLTLGGYETVSDYNLGPSAQCGLLNAGAILQTLGAIGLHLPPPPPVPAVQLQATQSYWGSANGPATSGSGDAVGGACDQNNAVTLSKPFATAVLSITLPP
jgi:hypothetical protein